MPPDVSALPPELWIRILSHHPDPVHLWSTCRILSRTWQSYVETVVSTVYLRYFASICFSLEKYNLGGKTARPEISCTFDRFEDESADKDGTGSDKDQSNGREKFAKVMDRWEERVATSKPETPHYTIRIGRLINDTALPGLVFSKERREIGFSWLPMIRLFFREQERLRTLKSKYHLDVRRTLESNRKKLAKGEALSPEELPKSWASLEPDVRKSIRRVRLKEAYSDNEEMQWAIGSLKVYESSKGSDGKVVKALSEIPGAGMGERWFGSTYLIQALYLDEWSCLHGIDTKSEHLAHEAG
ncbi:hypothetical protein BU24DRAFT_399619 [Aaosphaeria arxii CBS 175.79]|uniref:F-box domain-containing protein n=1 Tax=Aaosphaeria arxii CBS 175.79 TaxID=1450172 RepID=A0A6A5XC37_9PLEO|nr:uncharacterized protein BU24DRAFT_399619 [Aaosphaeria arxii CBS 175.79]KAF2010344.1 hypothetical protein BU24DRAFT_399619 [Aaosphaeria arxii CBS 175.79]